MAYKRKAAPVSSERGAGRRGARAPRSSRQRAPAGSQARDAAGPPFWVASRPVGRGRKLMDRRRPSAAGSRNLTIQSMS